MFVQLVSLQAPALQIVQICPCLRRIHTVYFSRIIYYLCADSHTQTVFHHLFILCHPRLKCVCVRIRTTVFFFPFSSSWLHLLIARNLSVSGFARTNFVRLSPPPPLEKPFFLCQTHKIGCSDGWFNVGSKCGKIDFAKKLHFLVISISEFRVGEGEGLSTSEQESDQRERERAAAVFVAVG